MSQKDPILYKLIILVHRLIEMHAFTKIHKILVRSLLVEMVLLKSILIMNLQVILVATGHHSGSIQCKIGTGLKMLR